MQRAMDVGTVAEASRYEIQQTSDFSSPIVLRHEIFRPSMTAQTPVNAMIATSYDLWARMAMAIPTPEHHTQSIQC